MSDIGMPSNLSSCPSSPDGQSSLQMLHSGMLWDRPQNPRRWAEGHTTKGGSPMVHTVQQP